MDVPSDIRRVQKGKKRGQVAVGTREIPAFPSIGRIYHLEAGLERYAPAFYLEEKLDGFNARYFSHRGRIFGLTRGGFVCPFLTDRTDLVDETFFRDYPGWTLCGEIVGRANPYLSECHLDLDDVGFFVFAVIDDKGRFLAPEKRYRLLENYSLRTVRSFGRFTRKSVGEIKKIIHELHRHEREGIVIKDARGRRPSRKYVTAFSDLNDLRHVSSLLGETAPGYFTERIQRLLAHCWEFSDPSHLDRLGSSFRPALEIFDHIAHGGKVSERYTMNVHHRETAEAFKTFLSRSHQVEIQPIALEPVNDGFWRFTFERRFPKATGRLQRMLGGKLFYD